MRLEGRIYGLCLYQTACMGRRRGADQVTAACQCALTSLGRRARIACVVRYVAIGSVIADMSSLVLQNVADPLPVSQRVDSERAGSGHARH